MAVPCAAGLPVLSMRADGVSLVDALLESSAGDDLNEEDVKPEVDTVTLSHASTSSEYVGERV